MSSIAQSDIKRLGTIMGIWAHPDDETFLAAGLLQVALGNGQTIVCVTATKGEAGVKDAWRWQPEKLGKIRAQELKRALTRLGVTNHHWLGISDGQCSNADTKKIVNKLEVLVRRYKPDTIITFGPEGMTGHPDHAAVSRWTTLVVARSAPDTVIYHAVIDDKCFNDYLKKADEELNIFFNIKSPPIVASGDCDIHLSLSANQLERKIEALRSMPSQTEDIFKTFDEEFIKKAWGTESFVRATGFK